ncbi:MAG TPA: hypothetical protein VK689_07960 [Armatimonadota bacterium]|nr:hypothetical protein [Armatimonadota bacterium]
MNEVVGEFPWKSERTPNEVCRVSIRESRGQPRVYVEAYAGGQLKSKGVTFRPEELRDIIAALTKAQVLVERSG